ncbi:secretin N-terminal domain-containing protein [Bathymodiolus platifrons methanotrophic gill symbiont]|uniref:secretin N-terminal domain-containing protein n=1 Tax=Bathymodiolus platifrons methanotrophic gill symbiont TaxID=113268 RepID=UPI001FCE1B2B|nr:secretin N-terminal domain-containing protein [Bathymodiolus platifrons methanotrophic gill symbiont]
MAVPYRKGQVHQVAKAGESGIGGGGTGQGNDRYSLLSNRGTAIVDSRTNTLIVKDTGKIHEEIREMIDKLDRQVR